MFIESKQPESQPRFNSRARPTTLSRTRTRRRAPPRAPATHLGLFPLPGDAAQRDAAHADPSPAPEHVPLLLNQLLSPAHTWSPSSLQQP